MDSYVNYDQTRSYGLKAHVFLYGCVLESLIDNNTYIPMIWDGDELFTLDVSHWRLIRGNPKVWAATHPKPAASAGFPYNGMGRVVLKKNMIDIAEEGEPANIVNLLTQDAFKDGEGNPLLNTVFVVLYDFVMGEDIPMPANCVLQFEGGSISGAGENKNTITGNKTKIYAGDHYRIFNSVILEGIFDSEYLTVEQFGVKYGSGFASANTTILNDYIIPSMENIGLKLIIPASNEVYRIDNTISMDGSFDFVCLGELFYEGMTENTAIAIIPSGFRPINKTYRIKLSANNVTYTDSDVPNRIGIHIENLNNCEIYFDKVVGFTYPIILEGNNTGFTANKVYLKEINNYYHHALTLRAIGNGWINENAFYGGNFTKLSDDNNASTAVVIMGNLSADHVANNNIFFNPCFEGCDTGMDLSYAKNNFILHPRLERVITPLKINDPESADNIIFGNYHLVSNDNKNNICIDDYDLIKLKGNIIFDDTIKIFRNGSTHLSNVYQLQSTDAGQTVVVESTNILGYYGIIMDVSVYKRFLISTNVNSTRAIFFLNNNYQIISTPENISYYIENNKTYTIPSKKTGLQDGGARKESQVIFTNNVTTVMLCIKGDDAGVSVGRLTIRSLDSGTPNDILLFPLPLKFFTTMPSTAENTQPGEQIFVNAKPYWWTGSGWVDATGQLV